MASTCEECHQSVELYNNFCCHHCGVKLPNEELQIKYYFSQGYEYSVILEFLRRFHGVTMCLRTLKKPSEDPRFGKKINRV